MKFGKMASTVVFYLLIAAIFVSVTSLVSRTTMVVAQMIPVERQAVVVIDAGHGGEDGGAVSCTGRLESELNLEIAAKLDALMKLLGYETRMIRTSDCSVYTQGTTIAQKKVSDLKERVRIVNETENALLVSIHQNTFPDSRYSGAQVFCGGADGSRELAQALQNSLVTLLNPGSNRQYKPAQGIYLMENARCTAVLVECGFLSNAREEALLADGEYQNKLCCILSAGVANFLDRMRAQ